LLRAYRATHYRVAGIVVRVGRRSAALDAMLAARRARTAIFVTAWNPLSRRMPPGRNHRLQRQLATRLRRFAVMPAEGSLRRWHEAHVLVLADPRPVLRLARQFHQRAVLVVRRGQPARLILLHYAAAAI
jgi:hypothetical protein